MKKEKNGKIRFEVMKSNLCNKKLNSALIRQTPMGWSSNSKDDENKECTQLGLTFLRIYSYSPSFRSILNMSWHFYHNLFDAQRRTALRGAETHKIKYLWLQIKDISLI